LRRLKVLHGARRRWQLARAASNCGAIATLSSSLGSVTLRGGLLGPISSINELGGLSMTVDSVTPTEQTMAITDVFSPNDVRTLVAWGDAMRNLVGWCSETRQPIDLHLYVDDATLSRIWCKSMRFQCPHCGIKHETKVGRLASKPLSLEPPQTKRTRHQVAAPLFARAS
jgi:hypothetical protein